MENIEKVIEQLNLIKSKETLQEKEIITAIYQGHLMDKEKYKLAGLENKLKDFTQEDIIIIAQCYDNNVFDIIDKGFLKFRKYIHTKDFITECVFKENTQKIEQKFLDVAYFILNELKELVN